MYSILKCFPKNTHALHFVDRAAGGCLRCVATLRFAIKSSKSLKIRAVSDLVSASAAKI